MKRTLLTVAAAISLGALNFVQAQPPAGPHGGWHHNPLEELSNSLNLTDAEKTKIQPIIDQAKPHISDPTRNSAVPPTSTGLRPNTSDILP